VGGNDVAFQYITHINGGVIDRREYEAENTMFSELYGRVDSELVKFTPLGGIAVKLINKTGSASVKGYILDAHGSIDGAVKLVPVDEPDCIGCFLDSGVADGELAWVVVAGIAEVYFSGSTVNGHYARVGVSADTGEAAGQAVSEAVPTSPFATDKHFAEIGHVIQARTGAGLAKVVLHFN
jgi:hypothetical protein